MAKEEVTFREGMERLDAALRRLKEAIERKQRLPVEECERVFNLDESDLTLCNEPECERCEEYPCVCGEPEFETHNSQELDRAQEVD